MLEAITTIFFLCCLFETVLDMSGKIMGGNRSFAQQGLLEAYKYMRPTPDVVQQIGDRTQPTIHEEPLR